MDFAAMIQRTTDRRFYLFCCHCGTAMDSLPQRDAKLRTVRLWCMVGSEHSLPESRFDKGVCQHALASELRGRLDIDDRGLAKDGSASRFDVANAAQWQQALALSAPHAPTCTTARLQAAAMMVNCRRYAFATSTGKSRFSILSF